MRGRRTQGAISDRYRQQDQASSGSGTDVWSSVQRSSHLRISESSSQSSGSPYAPRPPNKPDRTSGLPAADDDPIATDTITSSNLEAQLDFSLPQTVMERIEERMHLLEAPLSTICNPQYLEIDVGYDTFANHLEDSSSTADPGFGNQSGPIED